MRENIDSLRRERVMFEQMYAKLEKDLGVKRSDMARLIDEVGQVYEDRDAVFQKLQHCQL